jgi:hypothetical protein
MFDRISLFILFALIVIYTAVIAWLNSRDPPKT